MKIHGLFWFEGLLEKIEKKHQVYQYEIKDVLAGKCKFRFVEKGHQKGENLYAALGQTRAGRYLTVFFIYKKTGHAIVVSARDMTSSERGRYEEK